MTPAWANIRSFRDAEWMDDAACTSVGTEAFYPEVKAHNTHRKPYKEALALCERCPVKRPCLEMALRLDERHGVWGGTIPSDRKRIRRASRRPQPKSE